MPNPLAKLFAGFGKKPVTAVKNQAAITVDSGSIFGVSAVSPSGAVVNERTAMSVSAVYRCVSLIGGSIASLPKHVFKDGAGGAEKADHPLYLLLNREPTPLATAAVFWEYLLGSLLLHGDSFARIMRPSFYSPDVTGFEPWHPSNVEVRRESGRLKYVLDNGDKGGRVVVDQDDMIHVPGVGFNGLRGMSQLRHALLNSVGVAISANEHTAAFFSNGARPDFVLKLEGNMDPEARQEFRDSWDQMFGGARRSHRPAILEGGLDLKEITMNAEDAQLLSTRQFQVEDIARIFGVPPFMIGSLEKSSSWGTGIEQMSIGFVKYTLMPILVKFEQEFDRKVLRDPSLCLKFNTAGLERGDLKTRYEAHRTAIGRAGEPGFMLINECRALENLPPVEGGDILNRGDHASTSSSAG